MTHTLAASPAYTIRPGTMVLPDGIIFSAVFHDCRKCGLLLYHLPDLSVTDIPFTDAYRYGSLYSVKIDGITPSEWGYSYYTDKETFCDPYARELLPVTLPGQAAPWKSILLSRPFTAPENTLPAYGSRGKRPWGERILYCVHPSGFTASKTSKVMHKGTFRGIVEKIPYLLELGINGVELMPVYELRERATAPGETLEEDGTAPKENYWNFGEGSYFAPKRSYAERFVRDAALSAADSGTETAKPLSRRILTASPQKEFAGMIDAMHAAGIEVFLQLYFPDNVTIQTQLETARFYVTHYGIDGFHLKGNASALQTIASDPMLSDTALFYYSFPYEDLQKKDRENPVTGKPSVQHLCEYTDRFQTLARRFVKSDNHILREFIREFVTVPAGHGSVHYITNYEGFTLMDLVSYNWKHNEKNGEDNHDGNDNNWSWNCGVEGPSQKKDIRALRRRQMRNLLALNFLAQGTPLLLAGDERCNSQDGNNNPYCQNNETGWVSWKDTKDTTAMLDFTKKILAFRKSHGVFSRSNPFGFNDPMAIGYPDISLHGKEAWKPDLSGYSHTVGILLPEQYAPKAPKDAFLYLAINMHWHAQRLALPKLPLGYRWKKIIDTFLEESFLSDPELLSDSRAVDVRGRSIQILEAVFDADLKKEQERAELARKNKPLKPSKDKDKAEGTAK